MGGRDGFCITKLRPWTAWASQACSEVPGGVPLPRGARGDCANDEREPLIPTPAYPLTAARFPAFSLVRFGFAGNNGIPNLSLNRFDTELCSCPSCR